MLMIVDSMIKIVMFGLVCCIFIIVLKPTSPHISLLLSLAASIMLFLFIMPFLNEIINFFKSFSTYIDFKTLYLDIVLKIICISYICEIGAEICKDANINSVASKIELGGKILIMCLSMPIVSEVLNTVLMIL